MLGATSGCASLLQSTMFGDKNNHQSAINKHQNNKCECFFQKYDFAVYLCRLYIVLIVAQRKCQRDV
jgi:hypothetical protein